MRRWVLAITVGLALVACGSGEMPAEFKDVAKQVEALPGVKKVDGGRGSTSSDLYAVMTKDAPASSFHEALALMRPLMKKYPNLSIAAHDQESCPTSVTWFPADDFTEPPLDPGADVVTNFVEFGRQQCQRSASRASMSQVGFDTWCIIQDRLMPDSKRFDEAVRWPDLQPECTRLELEVHVDSVLYGFDARALARPAARTIVENLMRVIPETKASVFRGSVATPDSFDVFVSIHAAGYDGTKYGCLNDDLRSLYTAARALPGVWALDYCLVTTEVRDGHLVPYQPDYNGDIQLEAQALYEYAKTVADELNR